MVEAVPIGSDRHCAGFDPVAELSTGFWEGGGAVLGSRQTLKSEPGPGGVLG
jgi:hypothetical protein